MKKKRHAGPKDGGRIFPEREDLRIKEATRTFFGVEPKDLSLAEAAYLADYRFDKYKSRQKEESVPPDLTIEVLIQKESDVEKLTPQIRRHRAIAEGVLLARNLINEPGNVLNPPKLAAEAQAMAKKKKLTCKVLGKADLQKLKIGGILAVNRGSTHPPALIILEHGAKYKNKGTICLVGKGVTFDTGGISLKPPKDMDKMKYDMSGAAAVIGTMGILADLNIPRHVVGLAPAVENIIAVDPQRPGDIIRMFNGKTVEVLNTDAEGRLILADALAYCEKYHPKAILDAATLTGMALHTFGEHAIALMGNDQKLIDRVQKAGEETGERCWQLPLWEDYRSQIVGHHSDLCNIGGPYGGTITAGMFLKEFIPEKTSWAHLDIAGVAWASQSRSDCVRGATGAGVRLFTYLIENWK